MIILEKAIMPNGVKIQLEDWREQNQGIQIGAYPIVKNSSKYKWVIKDQPFRLTIAKNEYLGYLEKAEWQEKEFDLKALVEESHQTLKEHGEGNSV